MTAEHAYDSQPTQPLPAVTAVTSQPPASAANADSPESEMVALRQQLALLQRQVANQQAQIATLIHQLNQPVAAPVEIIETRESTDATVETVRESATPTAGAITSRRALLKWGGLGAAAIAAAGTAALSAAPTAHAADGENLVLGAGNGASTMTSLSFGLVSVDPNAPNIGFEVTNGTVYPDDSLFLKAAIRGVASNQYGLVGVSGSYIGVDGSSTGAGVLGFNNSGGVGVEGRGIYDFHANGSGYILQKSWGGVGAPAGPFPEQDFHLAGEIVQDNNHDIWICIIQGGSIFDSYWKKVATLNQGYKGGAVGLLQTPSRVYDTRKSGGPFHGNAARNVQVASTSVIQIFDPSKVPNGAAGCVGNLTITNPTAGGYAVIYPQGSAVPSTSTVNFLAGQTRANSFIVGLGSTGQVSIHTFTSGQCDVILDITGFIS